ncbi:MAG: glycosyltransferase [Thermoplasmata archaeon]|nr:glycosyltransferase [Thermoplasmata archaeon]
MGSSPPNAPPFVSIVITVRNEAPHLPELLDSLLRQAPPFEIVLVDARSHDGTPALAKEYARRHPDRVRVFERSGSRGIGRNEGARRARAPWLAFIDGDCSAHSDWLAQLRSGLADSPVAAGRTIVVGPPAYANLERVELYQGGNDVTFPSCNLGYRRSLFLQLGGFDPRFITAEDIDLNLRAVQVGARIQYVPGAVVYHRTRPTWFRFLYQAFWNGYGRKQLTEKHGTLWGNYRFRRLLHGQRSVLSWARLVAALAGYFTRVMTGGGRRLDGPPPPFNAPSAAGAGPSESAAGQMS